MHEMTQQMREVHDLQANLYSAGPEIAEVREVHIPTTGGFDVPARIYRPADAKGVIVYLHGGGFIIGSIVSYDTHCRLLADETGFTVLLAEYRKAPETKYPGAHDDGWAALTYAADHIGELAFEGAQSSSPATRRVPTLQPRSLSGPRKRVAPASRYKPSPTRARMVTLMPRRILTPRTLT
jgi:acetyl esterase/lipase